MGFGIFAAGHESINGNLSFGWEEKGIEFVWAPPQAVPVLLLTCKESPVHNPSPELPSINWKEKKLCPNPFFEMLDVELAL